MTLNVATAAEIAAANAAAAAAAAPKEAAPTPATAATAPTNPATAGTTPPTTPAQTAPGAKPGTAAPTTTARGGRGNQSGQQGGGRGGRSGGFTGVSVNGGGADTTEAGGDQAAAGAAEQSGLGGAAVSADALLLNGTTAQGVDMGGGFGQGPGGFGGGDPNNPGAPQSLGLPGQNPGGDFGAGGGPGGPGGGGGRGGPGGGGGGGGRGGGAPGGGRGGRGAQNGPPWGLSSVIRRRINQEHYTLNETLLDSAFNARAWNPGEAVAKPSFLNNKFGGSLGGPLRIPHIYDGRDKTFFFLNVNVGHGTNGFTNSGYVPTALERAGNFCSSGTNGAPLALYNYATSTPGNLQTPRTLLAGTGTNNCDISGINPATSEPFINPTAANLLALIPMPNEVPSGTSGFNYVLQGSTPTNTQAINMRVNQTISAKLNLGVQYNISQNQSSSQGLFPSETASQANRAQVVNLTLNQNISQRLINTILLNFTRSRTDSLNGFANNTNEEALLGILGGATNPLDFGLPSVSFSNTAATPYSGFNDTIPSLNRNETWNLTDTLSWTLPKHTLHYGFTFRRVQLNSG